ncbi:Fc.00g085360.m01.CDS01 [Cosmosporella sp. VM-42]
MDIIKDISETYFDEHNFEPIHDGLIAQLYNALNDLCRTLLGSGKALFPLRTRQSLRKTHSALILWAHSYDVARGSLDLSLGNSPELRRLTVNFLVNMCSIFLKRLIPFATGISELEIRLEPAYIARSKAFAFLGGDPDLGIQPPLEGSALIPASSDMWATIEALKELEPLLEDLDADEENQPHEEISTMAAFLSTNLKTHIKHIFPKCNDDVALGIGAVLLKAWKDIESRRRTAAEDTAMYPFIQEEDSPDGHHWNLKEINSHPPAINKLENLINLSVLQSSPSPTSELADAWRPKGWTTEFKALSIGLPVIYMAQEGLTTDCIICKRSHPKLSLGEQKQHLLNHMGPNICLATGCTKRFGTFETGAIWSAHMSTHPIEAILYGDYNCPICGKSLLGKTSLNHAEVIQHLNGDLRPLAAELLVPGVTFAPFSTLPIIQSGDHESVTSATSISIPSPGDQNTSTSTVVKSTPSIPSASTSTIVKFVPSIPSAAQLQQQVQEGPALPSNETSTGFSCLFQYAKCSFTHNRGFHWAGHVVEQHLCRSQNSISIWKIHPPTRLYCPAEGCGRFFTNQPYMWAYHVGHHLEEASKGEEPPINFLGPDTRALRDWAEKVGMVTRIGWESWELVKHPKGPQDGSETSS